MTDPNLPARQANEICRAAGIVCKYEFDRRLGKFRYRFYRRGVYIGGTAAPSKVVNLAAIYSSSGETKK